MRNELGKLRSKIRIPIAKRSLQHPKANPLIFPDLQQSALQFATFQDIHSTGDNKTVWIFICAVEEGDWQNTSRHFSGDH
jgi:hypothetical protein